MIVCLLDLVCLHALAYDAQVTPPSPSELSIYYQTI